MFEAQEIRMSSTVDVTIPVDTEAARHSKAPRAEKRLAGRRLSARALFPGRVA
jgi:hypothetical protein